MGDMGSPSHALAQASGDDVADPVALKLDASPANSYISDATQSPSGGSGTDSVSSGEKPQDEIRAESRSPLLSTEHSRPSHSPTGSSTARERRRRSQAVSPSSSGTPGSQRTRSRSQSARQSRDASPSVSPSARGIRRTPSPSPSPVRGRRRSAARSRSPARGHRRSPRRSRSPAGDRRRAPSHSRSPPARGRGRAPSNSRSPPARNRVRAPSFSRSPAARGRRRSLSRSPPTRGHHYRRTSRSPPRRRVNRSFSRSPGGSRSPYARRNYSGRPVPRVISRPEAARMGVSTGTGFNGSNRDNPDPSKVLGVFNLSRRTDEESLRKVFGRFGEIDRLKLIRDRFTMESRCFGFVKFVHQADATDARHEVNGVELDGRSLRVDYSVTDHAHEPTPGLYCGEARQRDYDRRRRHHSKRSRSRSPPRRTRY